MKGKKRVIAIVSSIVLVLSLAGTGLAVDTITVNADENVKAAVAATAKIMSEKTDIYNATGKYIADTNPSIAYGDYKEGYLIGLGRAGYPVSNGLYSGYYESVKSYIAENGKFTSVTECAKVVAALNAIGYDSMDIEGVDITGQLSDAGDVSGVYANAYTLIALDTKNYPSDARDTYINNLVNAQLADGSWGWDDVNPDNDTTGVVLAALAPHYNNNTTVTSAVERALNYLSDAQSDSGTYASYGDDNSNSTAMVVLGLSELGINADTDSRFIKNGVSVVDALCSYAVTGGGFGWTDNVEVNDYATYQSYYALCSYFRNINGMNHLFNMTDERVTPSSDDTIDTDTADTTDTAASDTAATARETKKVAKAPKTGDYLFR